MPKKVLLLVCLLCACDRGPSSDHGRSEPLGSETPVASPTPMGPRDVLVGAAPGAAPVHGAKAPTPPPAMPAGHPAMPPGAAVPGGAEGAAPERIPFDPAHPSVAGVRFTVPAPFTYRAPAQTMRVAEYALPDGPNGAVASMTVHFFPGMGGSVESNVDRWVNQFTQPDGRASRDVAHVTNQTVHGIAITLVDVSGTFGGAMGMPGQPFEPVASQRLLGAIVNAPQGPVFFKLAGDASVVASAERAFRAMVASFEKTAP